MGGSEKPLQKPWKKRLKISPQDPPNEKGQLGTFWKETSKEEYSGKIGKGPATNVVDTTLVLVPRAARRGILVRLEDMQQEKSTSRLQGLDVSF